MKFGWIILIQRPEKSRHQISAEGRIIQKYKNINRKKERLKKNGKRIFRKI